MEESSSDSKTGPSKRRGQDVSFLYRGCLEGGFAIFDMDVKANIGTVLFGENGGFCFLDFGGEFIEGQICRGFATFFSSGDEFFEQLIDVLSTRRALIRLSRWIGRRR